MRRKLRDFFIFLLPAISLAVQWYSIGPDGGQVEMLVTAKSDSNTIYAALRYGSVFKSEDGGNSWIFIHWFPGIIYTVGVHPFDADIVYVGMSPDHQEDDALFRTANSGETWTSVGLDSYGILRLAIDPQNPQILYASSWSHGGGIVRSKDGGETWVFLPFSDTSGFAWAMAVHPESPNNIYVASNGWKFYRSSDYGGNWKSSTEIQGFPQWMDLDPSNTEIVYLATSYGVFKTTDGGETWAEKNGGEVDRDHPWASWVLVDLGNSQRIYRGNNHNWVTFISHDGGDNWKATDMPAGSMTVSGNSRLFVGTRDGIYEGDLDAENVRLSSSGLHGTDILSLEVDHTNGSRIYAATNDPHILNANLYMSNLDSVHWDKQHFGRGISELKIHPGNRDIVAAGLGWGKHGIKISLDGGNSWSELGPDDYVFSLAFGSDDSLTIYAGGNKTLYRSNDLGRSWNAIGLPSSYHDINDIALAKNDDVLVLAAESGVDWGLRKVIVRSLDGGQTWFREPIEAISVFIFPHDPGVILVGTHSQLFRSDDFGENWQEITFSSQQAAVRTFQFLRPNAIAMATSVGVFYSIDSGHSWSELSDDLPHRNVLSLSYSDTPNRTLFAGTLSGGIYRRNIEDVMSVISNEILTEFTLSQNYPNPFNPTTTIQYDLPRAGHVSLIIYDLLGREVEVAVSKWQEAGTHSVVWDASGVPTGIYFVRMVSGNFSQVKKVMVLK